jgi:hypothetical protein
MFGQLLKQVEAVIDNLSRSMRDAGGLDHFPCGSAIVNADLDNLLALVGTNGAQEILVT